VAAQVIKLEGLGLTSPWGQGIAVGVTVKALLHINLFTVRVGAQSSPFGLETLVQLFEPGLRRQILFDEDNAVKAYVQPLQGRYPDLVGVRARIKANIPAALPAAERAAFENDIDNAPTVERAAELFLRFAGRGTLARVFP
jgi:hypothetical protein